MDYIVVWLVLLSLIVGCFIYLGVGAYQDKQDSLIELRVTVAKLENLVSKLKAREISRFPGSDFEGDD